MRFEIDVYHHGPRGEEAPSWAERLADQLGLALEKLETFMATIEELGPLVIEIKGVVAKVAADTDKILADLSAIPTPGLTPEQQAAVDAAVAGLTEIRDTLTSMDAKVPDAPSA